MISHSLLVTLLSICLSLFGLSANRNSAFLWIGFVTSSSCSLLLISMFVFDSMHIPMDATGYVVDATVYKKTNLMHNLFLVYFINLYMFRAYLGPSSGGTTVCIQKWVLIILFRCLFVVLVGFQSNQD